MIRDFLEKLKTDGMMIFCGVVVLFYFGGGMYVAAYVKAANPEVMNNYMGQVSVLAGLVVGYFYGSSKGSAEKNKMLADKQPNA